MSTLTYGDRVAREVSSRIASPVASTTALAAISRRTDGQFAVVTANNSFWRFNSASTATDTTSQLIVVPDAGTGAWMRVGSQVDLKCAVAYTTADAAVLFTVPVGFKLRVARGFWEVTSGFTGGTLSAIGASSSNTAYNTKGDLLGGASGDVTAAIGSAGYAGTIGAKLGSSGLVVLVAGNTIKFDRITSVYTAGAGYAHFICDILS